jgi:AraC-like DNA-binding protein
MTPEELANLAHLRRARELMDRAYARPLDVAALARAALMSRAHFSRKFRATYGETPYAYLMTRRIERAKALLRRGDLSVTEVCAAVGCSSLGSFSARFTQLVGETPTAYRARDHRALASVPGCIAKDLTRPSRKTEQDRRSGRDGGSPSVRGMNLTLSTCFVLVHDPDLALGFYRDALGLELRNDVAREDFRWITVGAAAQPDVSIVLTNYLNGSPADADALAALVAKGADRKSVV